MKEMRNVYKRFVGTLKGRHHSEDLYVNGKIILNWILGKQGWIVWIGLILFRKGTDGHHL
jgi:hypothetical protein